MWTLRLLAAGALLLAHGCTKTDVTGVTIGEVKVSPESATLLVGESRQFSAAVKDVDGTVVPSSVVTWSTADGAVASVDAEGRAVALGAGSTQVRATARGVSGTATLTVQPGPTISVDDAAVSFVARRQGSNPDPVDVAIENAGNGTLSGLSATTAYAAGEPTGWLGLSLASTTAPTALTLTASIGSLAAGTYHATITLRASSAAADEQIQVELAVTEDQSILRLSPTAVGFSGVAGSSPPAAQVVQVTNEGGGSLAGLVASITYDGAEGWLTADLSATTAPATLTLRADPTDLVPGSYGATVQVSSPSAANGSRSVSVSFTVDAEPLADLSVSKTGPALIVVGDTTFFVITVDNAGPRDAVNAVVVDSLPSVLAFVSASGGGEHDGGVVTWPGRIVAAGTTVSDTVWVSATELGAALNVAAVSSVTPDPAPRNDRAEAASTVVSQPADVGLAKVGPSLATAGDEITYLLDLVHEDGLIPAEGIRLTDVLPPELIFVSTTGGGTYDDATRTVSWTISEIPVADRAGVDLTVRVAPTATGSIVNTARVSTLTRDPNADNDIATAVTGVDGTADLALTKSGPSTAASGERIVYSIRLDHVDGPSAATGVVVTDELPSNVTFVSASDGGTYDGAGSVTWAVDPVPVGGSTTLALTVDVDPTFTGSISNTARVSTTSTDGEPGNDVSTVSTTVSRVADVAVKKSAPATAPPGSDLVYSITVEHAAGMSDASGVVVTDVLPATLGFVSATAGGVWNAGAHTVTWTLGDLPVGSSVPLGVTTSVPSSATGSVLNKVSVTSTSSDPVTTNDTASVSTRIPHVADLALTKSAPDTAVAGSTFDYELTLTHVDGPNDAAGVVVTDPLPAGLTFVSATGGGTESGGVVTWDLGTLAKDASVDLSVTVDVDAGTSATLTNTATVTTTSDDPTPDNNSATTVTAAVQVADLSISKSGPSSTAQNSDITYTIRVTNNSPSSGASGVVVKDPLPASFTFKSASGGGTLAAGDTVLWSLGPLAPGEVVERTLIVNIGTATGSVTNTAGVSSTSRDPTEANDIDDATTTVVLTSDLAVESITVVDAAKAGSDIEYTIAVRNNGPDAAAGIRLTDTLPAALVWVPGVSSASNGGTYDDASRTVTWPTVTLAAAGTFTRKLTIRVGSDVTGDVTNAVHLTSATLDPDPSDNTASASTTVSQEADLAITKSGPATATSGTDVVYTIEVTNLDAASGASGVTIRDALPTELTFAGATGTWSESGGVVTWDVGPLGPGETATVQVTATVAGDFTGDLTNTATVSSSSSDPEPLNDADDAVTTVSAPGPV